VSETDSVPNPLASLDVFWTELSPNRAVVYARLTDVDYHPGWRLSGTIRGPRSVRHQTLPATIPFKDLGAGPTHLARVVVPEPSYWSPESPNIYDVTIELRRDGAPTLVEKRMLGFKPIRAGERYLLREGKTWIPRTMSLPRVDSRDYIGEKLSDFVANCRDAGLVLQVPMVKAAAGLRNVAAEEGLYLLTMISPEMKSLGTIREQLRECSKYPSVTFVTVPYYCAVPNDAVPEDGHNLILLQPLSRGTPYEPQGWANAVAAGVWSLDDPEQDPVGINKPVLIGEGYDTPIDASNARAYCDELQRRLAPLRQFAGYHVGTRS
jgi:hypothetical protein